MWSSGFLVGVAAVVAIGCGDDDGRGMGDPDAGIPDAGPVLPEPICGAGTRWAPGTVAFVEATAEWGLTGVEGTRLNVADVDGDGWADLLVRRGPAGSDDFAAGTRSTWLLRNTGTGTFEDVTRSSGIVAMRTMPDGSRGRPNEVAAFGDVDNDGDLDAYTGLTTVNPMVSLDERSELMLNDGTGRFSFGQADDELRSPDRYDVPAGASFVDYDRDGNLDLWIPQHNFTTPGGSTIVFMQDRLYRGDGTGRFVEVTAEAGLTTRDWRSLDDLNNARAHTRAWAALACDLNGDGTPELLAASYGRSPNHLWQGMRAADGTVTFTNRSVASGYAYDMDQTWTDNQFARCFCQANPTAEDCAGVPPPAVGCGTPNWNHDQDREPFRLAGNSAATSCGDLDGDGDMDLFTGEIRHWWAGAGSDWSEILVNSGESDVRFDRPGRDATGLTIDHGAGAWDEGHMTNAIFDFDDDGRMDIYVGASDYPGNRGRLYHQDAPLSFVEVATSDFFEHNRSHGVAVADFDRDGDLDVVVGHSRARCDATAPNNCYETMQVRLFENQLAGNFVQLALAGGAGTNRSAIGARVTLTAAGVTQTQEVGGGFGHYGAQHDMVLHFGLGAACEAEVTVRWPDAALTTQSFTLPAGHRFRIVQGATVPEAVAR